MGRLGLPGGLEVSLGGAGGSTGLSAGRLLAAGLKRLRMLTPVPLGYRTPPLASEPAPNTLFVAHRPRCCPQSGTELNTFNAVIFSAIFAASRLQYRVSMRGVLCPEIAISSGSDKAPVLAHVVTAQ